MELLPAVQLFTLLHVPGSVSPRLEASRPHRSFVQFLPWAQRHYRRYLPLFPAAVEQFDLDEFDLVISTSHCAAKSVVSPGRARHLCYCFTPMRYAWDQFEAYFGSQRVGPLRNRIYRLAFSRLARWDASTAGRVNRYVAISQHVAARIRRYYNRAASVVYPPVDTTFYRPSGSAPGPYFLIVSALVPYKRVDLAIEACRLAGVPLRIAGDWTRSCPDYRRWRGLTWSSWARAQILKSVTRNASRKGSCCQGKRTSASRRSKRSHVDGQWSRWGEGESPRP